MNRSRLPDVGLQLYTLRRLRADFATLVHHASAAGYTSVETFGPRDLDLVHACEVLDEEQMEVCSSHVALQDLASDTKGVCSYNRRLGNDVVIVPWLPEEERGTDRAGWERLGRRLGELGEVCAEEGVRLLYHNHDFELGEVEGRTGLDWLLDAADPEYLGLEPDLGWIARAGHDPAAVLATWSGRCPRVHLKDLDLRAVGRSEREADDEGGWRDVGHGTLGWEPLLRSCRDAGVEVFVVEHDEPADPIRSITRSADALRELL